jgi:HEAT repeat protein
VLAKGSGNVSLNKKLVTYHIGRLKDKSADVRLKAIHELAELGDPEALEALQETYRTDADLDVRKAAQEAGRAIFLKSQQNSQS